MMSVETMRSVNPKTVDRSTLVQRDSIRLEPDDAVINDGRVNGQGNHFHDESRPGIACAGYGIEQDE